MRFFERRPNASENGILTAKPLWRKALRAAPNLAISTCAIFALVACSNIPKPPKEVVVTVRGTCVPMNVPPRPDPNSYPDTRDKLLGMNEGPQRYAALLAGNLLRKDRLDLIEPVVDACR